MVAEELFATIVQRQKTPARLLVKITEGSLTLIY
jgi:hypothetical protein